MKNNIVYKKFKSFKELNEDLEKETLLRCIGNLASFYGIEEVKIGKSSVTFNNVKPEKDLEIKFFNGETKRSSSI